MARPAGVYVAGVRELRRDLRRVAPALLPELRQELKAAGEVVAKDAKRRVRRSIRNPSRSTGRAEGSLRVLAGGNKIYLAGGKASVPYFGWLDFGGELRPIGYRKNTISRSAPKRGRYIYPAIGANIHEVVAGVEDAVERTLRKVNLT